MPNYEPFKKQTLADQVAASIEESIVSGAVKSGEMLPTESEMSEQFGVSRAVVRDATRMVAAKGLIEIRHGKGSFVTQTQTEAFGDALLLALRRMDASNWDVAQFEQAIYPEILALAATHATDGDIARIQAAADAYLVQHAQIAASGPLNVDSSEYRAFQSVWSDFVQTVFDATHNKVFMLLARPLIQLHGVRNWEGLSDSLTYHETQLVTAIIDLIKARDPAIARQQMKELMALPPEAVSAMRQTSVASPTTIVLNAGETP